MFKSGILLTLLMVVVISIANAQERKYWVVETAITGNSVVKIYDANHKLVKEMNADRRIDITRRRERKTLNRILKQNDAPLWSKR
jgi:hypothetical protein